jgi:hypothetical protein
MRLPAMTPCDRHTFVGCRNALEPHPHPTSRSCRRAGMILIFSLSLICYEPHTRTQQRTGVNGRRPTARQRLLPAGVRVIIACGRSWLRLVALFREAFGTLRPSGPPKSHRGSANSARSLPTSNGGGGGGGGCRTRRLLNVPRPRVRRPPSRTTKSRRPGAG